MSAERIGYNSYFSLAGWAVQTLRPDADQGMVPLALPVLDYRRRLTDPLLGGKLQLQLNSLATTRSEGQDTKPAFAVAQRDPPEYTPRGKECHFNSHLLSNCHT